MERIQREYSERQPLVLSALSEDGLSLQLQATNSKQLRAAVDKVQAAGWLAGVEEVDKGALRISVKEPRASSHPGELLLEFNPGSAFAELRKDLAPDEQRAVKFGCLFPNGGGALDGRLLPTDTTGTQHDSVEVEELKSAARRGSLELWSLSVAAVLHRPGLGVPVLALTSTGLQISVELQGADRAFWDSAIPMILFGHEPLDKRAAAESKILSKPLRVVKSVRYEVRPRARLEVASKDEDAFELLVSLATQGLPSGKAFKLELSRAQEPTSLKLPKTSIRYKLPRKGGGGVTDAEGIFRAELNVREVAAALGDAKEYRLRVVPLEPADTSLACEQVLTLPSALEPPLETLGDHLSELSLSGMWG